MSTDRTESPATRRRLFQLQIQRNTDAGARLRKSLLGRRQKVFKLGRLWVRPLQHLRRHERNVLNSYSRTLLLRFLSREVFDEVDARAPEFLPRCPVYHVTLIDRDFFLNDPTEVDEETIAKARRHYAKMLTGFDFVGMLDFALYVSTWRVWKVQRRLSIHAHLLILGGDPEELKRRITNICAKHRACLPYARAAKWQEIDPSDLAQMLWYTVKFPYTQYQVYRRREKRSLGSFKRVMTGANAVRLYRMIGQFSLDDLTLHGGRGSRAWKVAMTRWGNLKRSQSGAN